jgi:hypothetical protein
MKQFLFFISGLTQYLPYFSRDLENLSPNLSPTRREALIFPPTFVGKGVRGLGFSWTFPHEVKSQSIYGFQVFELLVDPPNPP